GHDRGWYDEAQPRDREGDRQGVVDRDAVRLERREPGLREVERRDHYQDEGRQPKQQALQLGHQEPSWLGRSVVKRSECGAEFRAETIAGERRASIRSMEIAAGVRGV